MSMLMPVIIVSNPEEIMGSMMNVHTTWSECTCKPAQAPGLGLRKGFGFS